MELISTLIEQKDWQDDFQISLNLKNLTQILKLKTLILWSTGREQSFVCMS